MSDNEFAIVRQHILNAANQFCKLCLVEATLFVFISCTVYTFVLEFCVHLLLTPTLYAKGAHTFVLGKGTQL